MNREDLKALATERTKAVDVEAAWKRVQPRPRQARRKPAAFIAAGLAAAVVIGVAVGTAVLVSNGDDDPVAVSSDARSSSPTTVDTSADSPPTAPEPETPPRTFQAFLDLAPSDPDGTRHVSITLPNGQSVLLNVSEEGLAVVGSMSFSETVYVACPDFRSCGDAEPKAYPREQAPPEDILRTFQGADDEPVWLVEHPFGRALLWSRSGWTIEVVATRNRVPESAYERWASSLIPYVDDQGWIQLRTLNGYSFGFCCGLNPMASLSSGDALVDLVPGTTCSPANDESSVVGDRRYASECNPGSGVLMNVQGNPDTVQFLLSVLSVG